MIKKLKFASLNKLVHVFTKLYLNLFAESIKDVANVDKCNVIKWPKLNVNNIKLWYFIILMLLVQQ